MSKAFDNSQLVNGNTTLREAVKKVDGSGSGLDADTVDGYHAGTANNASWPFVPVVKSSGVMEVGKYVDFHLSSGSSADFEPRLEAIDQHNLAISGQRIWHSGNDGAGSGLDADTVDGIQGADVMTRAPDFDSGWVAISANQTIYINHNLGVSPTKITTLMKPDGNGNVWGLVDTVNPRPIDGLFGSDGNMYKTSIEGVSGTQFIIRSGLSVWHGAASADAFNSGFIRILAWL